MIRTFLVVVLLALASLAWAEEKGTQLTLKNIRLVKISHEDRLATAKGPDGALRLLRVGDQLGKEAKVTEITRGKVVVEETTDRGVEAVFLVLDNGVQRVERIAKTTGERKNLATIGTISIPVPAQPVQ